MPTSELQPGRNEKRKEKKKKKWGGGGPTTEELSGGASSCLLCKGRFSAVLSPSLWRGRSQFLTLLRSLLLPPPSSLLSPLRLDASCYFMCRGSLSAGSSSSAPLCASDSPSPGQGKREKEGAQPSVICGAEMDRRILHEQSRQRIFRNGGGGVHLLSGSSCSRDAGKGIGCTIRAPQGLHLRSFFRNHFKDCQIWYIFGGS